jgi:hypothetical protein
MAFPAIPSDNQVHKTGDRTFVYDSTLGVWDQLKEANPQETGSISNTTLGSGVAFPSGHVLQVVSDSANKDSKLTTSSQSFVEYTGYSVTITPSSTSNKILVTAIGCILETVYNKSIIIRLSRDGGSSAIFEAGAYRDSNVSHEREFITLTKLDSPNTVSAITYKVYIKIIQAGGSCKWGEESTGSSEDCATITAMEIKG